MSEKRKIHLPTENRQRIQLAPGVTLVLDGARMRGHTVAVLPPGVYDVSVECHLRRAGGGAQARAEASFLLGVVGDDDD
ncbi:MAG: hypothetical protein GX484_05220 [Chloroflexi bacterium]|nr:hypothetical protein [Chloroflexota bacterium]